MEKKYRNGNVGFDYRRACGLRRERDGSRLTSPVLLTSVQQMTNLRQGAGLIFG